MAAIVGVTPFFFDFVEPGGPNNLLPGRPLEKTQPVDRPRGAGFVVSLAGFNGAFVTDGGGALTQRPLGQFQVWTGIRDFNVLVCRVRLTDENSDDPIHIQVRGTVLFFV
jgi:hypothetical protein